MTVFVVTGADLFEAAAWAARIVPARPPHPVLAGLLLDAGDELSITAFDFDTCGTATVPAIVKDPGRLLVSARLLTDIAKTVDRDVDVTVEGAGAGGVAEVRCGRAEWSMPCMDPDGYPQLPAGTGPLGTVDAAVLRRALARVLPAASRDAAGDVASLRGVRVEATDGVLTLVATDRYRLAAAEIPLASAGGFPPALVPADLLEAAVRASGAGEVALSCDDATFGLATDTHRLVGRQIAQEFPRWRGMVPDPGEHFAVVDVAGLGRAVAQARVMSPHDATVTLAFGGDSVRVSASDTDRRAHAETAVHAMQGEPAEVGLNPGYLRDGLAAMESEAVTLHFFERMVLMLPCAADGAIVEGLRYLVMRTRGWSR